MDQRFARKVVIMHTANGYLRGPVTLTPVAEHLAV